MNTYINFVYGYLGLWAISFLGVVLLLVWNRRLARRLKDLEDSQKT